MHGHFNPLPSCEGRHLSARRRPLFQNFNPLPSCEGRPNITPFGPMTKKFQSTPLMRGETMRQGPSYSRCDISIHSSHARGDLYVPPIARSLTISIHSPHARGDLRLTSFPAQPPYFNPLPSCEGRRWRSACVQADHLISIHSPHARGDKSHRR